MPAGPALLLDRALVPHAAQRHVRAALHPLAVQLAAQQLAVQLLVE